MSRDSSDAMNHDQRRIEVPDSQETPNLRLPPQTKTAAPAGAGKEGTPAAPTPLVAETCTRLCRKSHEPSPATVEGAKKSPRQYALDYQPRRDQRDLLQLNDSNRTVAQTVKSSTLKIRSIVNMLAADMQSQTRRLAADITQSTNSKLEKMVADLLATATAHNATLTERIQKLEDIVPRLAAGTAGINMPTQTPVPATPGPMNPRSR
ncbi:hypothetical protein FN846DRAFT_895412 [Sphaerosporella brunnea]|uniref:Uncharacterized protein n=1 Tax=Sphaerosporella brunnea TaxID=1250544 RepID=A0A5J5EF77_9PEZI|nr:hypothetical protein FN846DRAFT_895412 [Sphaerosporella brunnea]